MAENDEIFENEDIYTLTDEEGNESDYELIGSIEENGVTYAALIPYTDDDTDPEEYIVLRGEKDENGEEILVSIEDDEEFDRIADIFDDEFADIDYDMEPED
mgnify:FL=1